MNKNDRKSVILELINKFEIGTQEELTDKLNELGFNVSQATVSRDINQLNLIKVDGTQKKSKYAQTPTIDRDISPKIIELFRHVTQFIDIANNLVIVKTLAGNANSAGMAIDQMHLPQIVGSVAGDDTMLIITKTVADAEIVVKSLRMILNAQ